MAALGVLGQGRKGQGREGPGGRKGFQKEEEKTPKTPPAAGDLLGMPRPWTSKRAHFQPRPFPVVGGACRPAKEIPGRKPWRNHLRPVLFHFMC